MVMIIKIKRGTNKVQNVTISSFLLLASRYFITPFKNSFLRKTAK
jgi:hypothetical protein